MNSPLSYSELQSIADGHAERIAFIDFKLRFTGFVKRQDLNESFGLSDASASRMLSKYSELRPKNLKYNRIKKVNTIEIETYKPLIEINAETALGMLAHGFNKNKLSDKPILPYARIGAIPNQLDVNEVSKITRAISGDYAISCHYISNNSLQHNERVLVPLGLLFDGRNWIFRAYDRSEPGSNKFKNYNFSRATLVNSLSDKNSSRLPYEELSVDTKWNLQLPLVLEIHPNLANEDKKTLRKDFGMQPEQNELYLTEKAALLWILTKQWSIDVGNVQEPKNDTLKPYYKFLIKNKEMVAPYI